MSAVVVLRLREGPHAAHHGQHSARADLDAGEGALAEDLPVRHQPSQPAPAAEGLYLGGKLLPGNLLEAQVDGCVYPQAAALEHVRPQTLAELLVDGTGEVGRVVDGEARLLLARSEAGLNLLLLGRLGHVGIEVVLLDHPVEHRLPSGLAGLRVDVGRVVRGPLGQAGQKRGLACGQVLGLLVEVEPRGGLDAIGAVAVVDLVEVHLQDLVLGVAPLKLNG